MAPPESFELPYYDLRPLRLVNSQVSYQLEYRGIGLAEQTGLEPAVVS